MEEWSKHKLSLSLTITSKLVSFYKYMKIDVTNDGIRYG